MTAYPGVLSNQIVTLGQQSSDNSLPVVLPSNQSVAVGSYPVSTAVTSGSAAVTTVLPITSGSFGFSAPQLAAADIVVISCFTNNCNVLWDGNTPTATFGHPLTAGGTILSFEGNAKINNVKVVSQTGTSNVTITLEQYP